VVPDGHLLAVSTTASVLSPKLLPVITGGPLRYQCVTGEPWTCEWFGIGCSGSSQYTVFRNDPTQTTIPGVQAPAPAAPTTTQQMTQPGAWTPAQSAGETNEEYQRRVQAWLDSTSGVAQFQGGLYQVGEAVRDTVSNPLLWLALGAAGLVVLMVAVKR